MLHAFARPRLWLGIWIFGITLCIALSLLPPIALAGPEDADKLGHALAYFTLSAWAMMIFRTRRTQLWALLGLFLLGVSIEFAQANLTVTRHGDLRDVYANSLGLLIGLALSFTPLAKLLLRLDRHLAP